MLVCGTNCEKKNSVQFIFIFILITKMTNYAFTLSHTSNKYTIRYTQNAQQFISLKQKKYLFYFYLIFLYFWYQFFSLLI